MAEGPAVPLEPAGQHNLGRNVELVPTPTYASYLNRIECHFWAISELVVKNADYGSWDELAQAMAAHISYRNGPHRDRRLAEAERRKRVA